MALIANDRDTRLQGTVPRMGAEGAGLIVLASSQTVRLDGTTPFPATVTFEAVQFVQGVVTWSVDGAALTGTGLTRSIDTTTITKDTVTVTATVTPAGGTPRSHTVTLSRVANGSAGSRGAGMYYVFGSSWSDTAADMATPGENVVGDIVTIGNNGAGFLLSKRWEGTAWVAPGTVLDGNLLVTGSVQASKVHADSLSALSSEIGFFYSGTVNGAGTAISGPVIQVTDNTGAIRVKIGKLI